MLFNKVDLKVFNFENEYWVCARTKEEALKYHLYNTGDEGIDWEVTECNLITDGVYADCTLDCIFEAIRNSKDGQDIKVTNMNNMLYMWTSFKDIIQDHVDFHGMEKVPFEIAWSDY